MTITSFFLYSPRKEALQLQFRKMSFRNPAIKLVCVAFPVHKIFRYSLALSLAQDLFNAIDIIVLDCFL